MDSQFLSEIYQISKEGCMAALIEAGLVSPYLSQAEAYRVHGRYTIEKWTEKGLIHPVKTGPRTSKVLYHREELYLASVNYFKNINSYRINTHQEWNKILSKWFPLPESRKMKKKL